MLGPEHLLSLPVPPVAPPFPGRTDGRRSAGTVTSHPRGCRRHRAGQPLPAHQRAVRGGRWRGRGVVVRQRGGVHHRRRTGPGRHRQPHHGSGGAQPDPVVEPPTAQHRRVHPRPHRPRLRHSRVRRGVGDERVGAARGGGAPGREPPLRPLLPDRRLQRGDQPAAVPHPGAPVAHRLPPARRHLRRPPRPGRGRPGGRAAPRPRRDRRPHLGVGARAADAVHRRPLHLVHPERREPPEGAALRP